MAAKPGMGKTSLALWLSRHSHNFGRIWLFVSMPSVSAPFAPFGLTEHLQTTFGFGQEEMVALQQRKLVLILDSLDEVLALCVQRMACGMLVGGEGGGIRYGPLQKEGRGRGPVTRPLPATGLNRGKTARQTGPRLLPLGIRHLGTTAVDAQRVLGLCRRPPLTCPWALR